MKFVIDALHALIPGKIAIIKLCHFNDDGVLMLSLAKKASPNKNGDTMPAIRRGINNTSHWRPATPHPIRTSTARSATRALMHPF
jgi:hypothetical protein